MTRHLDVLVLESERGAARKAEAALTAAGHRVHRCHEVGDRGFPCLGLTEPAGCPLDRSIDVALVVRSHVDPKPTPLEDGVSCAIRAGVPLVEDGPDLYDPYGSWLADRVDEQGVVAAVHRAAAGVDDPLRTAILDRCALLLQAHAIPQEAVACSFEPDGGSLRVELAVDAPVDRQLSQAMAVRVLDAVRSTGRTYGHVDVRVGSTLDALVG
jgi:hypothetical protein